MNSERLHRLFIGVCEMRYSDEKRNGNKPLDLTQELSLVDNGSQMKTISNHANLSGDRNHSQD